jgi:uncharacterized membrane protein YphA (DoxX/SURF4 family)
MTTISGAGVRIETVGPWVSTVFRLGLGGVMMVAGALKVVDPQTSVQAVAAYRLLPAALVPIVGWGLPFLEVALGLLLVGGVFVRVVATATGTLLVVFIAAVGSAAARGLSIDCGCFGRGGQVTPGRTAYAAEIVRDVGFLLMAAWLVWRPRSRYALERGQYERVAEL